MKKIFVYLFLSISCIYAVSNTNQVELNTDKLNTRLNPNKLDNNLLNYAIFWETNRQRKRYNKPLLTYSKELEKVAKYHSYEMVKYNYLGHYDKNGNSFKKRIIYHNLPKTRIAENCALSFGIEYNSNCKIKFNGNGRFKKNGRNIPFRKYESAARNIVNNLMNSRGHRRNILDNSFTQIGVGVSFFNKESFNNILSIKTTQIFIK